MAGISPIYYVLAVLLVLFYLRDAKMFGRDTSTREKNQQPVGNNDEFDEIKSPHSSSKLSSGPEGGNFDIKVLFCTS